MAATSAPFPAFKNFRAFVKLLADTVCCVRKVQSNQSFNQSISVICIVTRCQIFTAEMHQIQFWLGFRPRHRWEPTGPLAGGDGAGCLVPQEPNPLARPSTLGPFGPRYTSSSYRLSPHKRKGQTPPICRQ